MVNEPLFDGVKGTEAVLKYATKKYNKSAEEVLAYANKLLLTYFSKVESVVLVSTMRYTDEVKLFTYLRKRYPEAKRYLMENASVLKEYFNSEIRHRKEVLIPGGSEFWHCYK